jgi:hypothetical protein
LIDQPEHRASIRQEYKMKPNNITRAIIDATVDRSLREIDEDPNRSIRKLTDMGRHFATGRFLDQIYDMLQDLLRNDDSPYYTAIRNLLRNTSRANIKEFGINVGYNSLTFGGKVIRSLDGKKPFNIPWCIVIHTNPSEPASIDAADVGHIVSQGNELGIYTYLIRCGGRIQAADHLFETFAAHPESAFICLLPEGTLSQEQLELIRKCRNTLFMFQAGKESSAGDIGKMKQQKSLFGLYDSYGDSTISRWTDENRAEEFLPYRGSFVIVVPDENCSKETSDRMSRFVKNLRTEPKYPFIIFEQRSDLMQIGRIITDSTNEIYLELLDDGSILTKDDTLIECRHTFSLEQILSVALPKE